MYFKAMRKKKRGCCITNIFVKHYSVKNKAVRQWEQGILLKERGLSTLPGDLPGAEGAVPRVSLPLDLRVKGQ